MPEAVDVALFICTQTPDGAVYCGGHAGGHHPYAACAISMLQAYRGDTSLYFFLQKACVCVFEGPTYVFFSCEFIPITLQTVATGYQLLFVVTDTRWGGD